MKKDWLILSSVLYVSCMIGSCKKDKSEMAASLLETDSSSISPKLRSWSKLYGGASEDWFTAVTPTDDGGYVAVGYSTSNDGDIYGNRGLADYWIVKINDNGDKIWSKVYGGSWGDLAQSVVRTEDGGYIAAGNSFSTDGDVVGAHGASDVWVLKIDRNGYRVWAKTYGGSANDYAKAVIATSDGGSLIVGTSVSTDGDIRGNLGGSDMWLIKLDRNGYKVWAKNVGTSSDDAANAVVATPDGGYILAGNIYGNFSLSDALLVKVDANGNQQWTKTFGGASYDYANKIIATADGGYMFVGAAGSDNGDISINKGLYDMWSVKLDENGNKVWSKTYGGSASDQAFEVITTSDNGFLLTGFSGSSDGDVGNKPGYEDMWVLKLDAKGAKTWGKTFGGNLNDAACAAYETTPGSFILAGNSNSNNGTVSGSHGLRDAWLLKTTE